MSDEPAEQAQAGQKRTRKTPAARLAQSISTIADSVSKAADAVGRHTAPAGWRQRLWGVLQVVAVVLGASFAYVQYVEQSITTALSRAEGEFALATDQLQSESGAVNAAGLRALRDLAFRPFLQPPEDSWSAPAELVLRRLRNVRHRPFLGRGRLLFRDYARSHKGDSLTSTAVVKVALDWLSLESKLTGLSPRDPELWFFFKARLQGARIADANLSGLNLARANLAGVVASSVNLQGANLGEAHLDGATFQSSTFDDARLERATLTSATLNYSRFECARFANANLEKATFTGANLRAAKLENAIVSNASFRSADLSDANLRGANLEGASFAFATLRGANLEGARLSGADFRFASDLDDVRWPKDSAGALMPSGYAVHRMEETNETSDSADPCVASHSRL